MFSSLKVRKETLPTRCDVCHQSDCFDPIENICWRCKDTFADPPKKISRKFATERCKVFHLNEIDKETNICNQCSNFILEAKKEDITEIRHSDWTSKINTSDANLTGDEIFKLFLFSGVCLGGLIFSVAVALYPLTALLLLLVLLATHAGIQNLFYYIKRHK